MGAIDLSKGIDSSAGITMGSQNQNVKRMNSVIFKENARKNHSNMIETIKEDIKIMKVGSSRASPASRFEKQKPVALVPINPHNKTNAPLMTLKAIIPTAKPTKSILISKIKKTA